MRNSTQAFGVTRRERLKKERQEGILAAAAAVFADKGYHQTTVRDIAERADVADGTIYNYFDSKSDLLMGIMSNLVEMEQLPETLTRAMEDDVQEFFVAAFKHRLGRMEQGEEMLKAILPQVFVNEDLRGRFYEQYMLPISLLLETYVCGQVEAGRIRPLNVSLITRIVQSIFVGLLVLRILGDEPLRQEWDQIPELLSSLVFDGLGVDGGG